MARCISLTKILLQPQVPNPPPKWTNNKIEGTDTDLCHFDNSGSKAIAYPITTPFAILDAGAISNNKLQERVALESPFFDSSISNYMQLDINSRIEYNNTYWTGLSWRYQDAAALVAGVKIKGLRIGASYDLTTSNLSKVSNGSVELFLGYCYTIHPKVKLNSLYNTRYL